MAKRKIINPADSITKSIGDAWIVDDTQDKYANNYYDIAETDEWMNRFWGESNIFEKRFKELDCKNITELACGHGRHVPKYLNLAKKITLVDINWQNINFCKERYHTETKIEYVINNGQNFKGIRANSQTAVFCYDAMVHFELLDILQYVKDAYRILKDGGKILFHHSNTGFSPEVGWNRPHGRNFMSADIFKYLAIRHGFSVLSQDIFAWGSSGRHKDWDCLSLCQKIRST